MKKNIKNVWEFLKQPNKMFSAVCYALFFITALTTILLLCLHVGLAMMPVLYSIMGLTFFYCVYLFVRFDIKKIKVAIKNLNANLSNKSRFFNKYFNDLYFRTMLSTIFSLVLGIGFVCYNAFAGFFYHSIWNVSIAIYYLLLVIIKIVFLFGEYKIVKNKEQTQEFNDLRRAEMFRLEGVFLLFVNIALIVPVTMLATSQKAVNLPIWVAIADASYTFYKSIVCVYSFVKTRKNNNLSVKGIKNLNLTSAIVSVLSLENTMILTFSTEILFELQILIIISAFVAVSLNFWIALSTLINGKKEVQLCRNKNV